MIATQPKTVSDPELVRVLRAYNDVTERLKQSHEVLAAEVCRLRSELAEKNVELQRRERLAALGEMAAGVAHEIRNPLGGIGLYASLLERDLQDRPREREIAAKISAGVVNLEAIVRDILAFAGGAKPRLRRMNLVEAVRAAVGNVEARAEAAHVTIQLGGDHDPVIQGDPAQIERAVVNLLVNAIEAVPVGGKIRVQVCENAGGLATVTVEDNGQGIPDQHLNKIFNPFFTTKGSGTGLGLAIVHRIAEEHGGQVAAGRSALGGARMVMSLPVADSIQGTTRRHEVNGKGGDCR